MHQGRKEVRRRRVTAGGTRPRLPQVYEGTKEERKEVRRLGVSNAHLSMVQTCAQSTRVADH